MAFPDPLLHPSLKVMSTFFTLYPLGYPPRWVSLANHALSHEGQGIPSAKGTGPKVVPEHLGASLWSLWRLLSAAASTGVEQVVSFCFLDLANIAFHLIPTYVLTQYTLIW